MAQSNGIYRLRPMQPSDSAGLTGLITEFDGDITTRFQVDPYAAIVHGTENETVGVVVECEGVDGLIGMGTMRFSEAQFNGDVLPLAFLDGLKVQPQFRGQGLGYQIAAWRVRQARERYGDQCMIATGMLHDNQASRGVAKKWCREFLDRAFEVWIMPVRGKPPRPPAGMLGGEIEPRQFEEFAAKKNAFFREYNFYQPLDANGIAQALAVEVEDCRPYRFYAVRDSRGSMIAGAQAWARGVLKTDTVNNLPPPVRLINRFAHLFPGDMVIRDIAVTGLWYESGKEEAASFLWEWMRWASREQGTTLAIGFDPRDLTREVVRIKPWHQPRPNITMAVHGPEVVVRGRLAYCAPRV